MNRIFYSLLIALTFTTNIVPLTESATLLAQKKTGKRVLLLGDVHDVNLEQFLQKASRSTETQACAQATRDLLHKVKNRQHKELTHFAQIMIADNDKKHTQTLVVSEISPDLIEYFCKKDAAIHETLHLLPHVLMSHVAALKPTQAAQINIEKFMSPLDRGNNNFFQVTDQLHFIAADCVRSSPQDSLFSSMAHEDLQSLKEQLPAHLDNITIRSLKKDLLEYQPQFAQLGINSEAIENLLVFIDELLRSGSSESELIIDVAIELQKTNPVKENFLHEQAFRFSSKKQDLELLRYAKLFEKKPAIKYLIINAGAQHTDFVKTRLIKSGFVNIEESTTNGCIDFSKTVPEEFLGMLSRGLNTLQQESPHSLLFKLFQA